MKLIKKTLIATAVASALLASTSAMAVWTVGPASPTTVIVQAKSVTATAASANVSFHLENAPQQALTVNDQVIFTLTGGAKFSKVGGIPQLSSSNSGNVSFDGFYEADGVTSNTTSGPIIKFHMTDGLSVATTDLILNTTANIFDLSGVVAGSNVDINITTRNVIGNVINQIDHISLEAQSTSDTLGYLFKGTNLISCTGIGNVKSATDTAQVNKGFKWFDEGGTDVDGTPLIYNTKNEASLPPLSITGGKIIYKILGDFNGIPVHGVTATTGSVTGSDSTGALASGSTANEFLINAGKTAAYAVSTTALTGGSTLVVAPQFHIDGITAQSARTFTLSTSVLDDTLWKAHDVSCDPATYSIDRNGSSFVINFLGAANKVRITDVSGSILAGTGKINITAYDQQGNVINKVGSFTPVALSAHETRIIAGTDLLAAYPTAVHFEFAVESPSIEAASLKFVSGAVTSTGVYTNKDKTGGI
ncbi:MAG: hypothetical protein Q7U57_05955 [Methylovulum sp.]|nr:hypothetical protein [Methylovulum sp.]